MSLTSPTGARQTFRWLVALLAACTLPPSAAFSTAANESSAELTTIADLRELAMQTASEYGKQHGVKLIATPAALDPRLRLTRCADKPQRLLADDGPARDYLTVKLQCLAPVRWSVYVRVALQSERPLLIAKHALARGVALTAADFDSRLTTVNGPGTQYMRVEDLHGELQLRLPLQPGAPLTTAAVEQAPMVRRGQQLTLLARAGGIEIRVAAIAMADGALSERIRVQNQSSHRLVDAVVRSGDLVEVGL